MKISHFGANKAMAMNGYLGITVQQLLYLRHKFKLRYPWLPVLGVSASTAVEGEDGSSNRMHWYSIETLSVVELIK